MVADTGQHLLKLSTLKHKEALRKGRLADTIYKLHGPRLLPNQGGGRGRVGHISREHLGAFSKSRLIFIERTFVFKAKWDDMYEKVFVLQISSKSRSI